MTAKETPAALLRRAADRVDALAEAASGTRWWTVLDDGRGLVYADTPRWPGETGMGHLAVAYESNRGDISEEDATWMGVLGPQIAAPLAAWLRAEADCAEQLPEATDALSRLGAAVTAEVTQQPAEPWGVRVILSTADQSVAFARSILGEAETA